MRRPRRLGSRETAALAATAFLAAALGSLAATWGSQSPLVQTYSSGTLELPIPDPGAITPVLAVPDAGQVTDVDVRVRLVHPRDGDLTIVLAGPDGTAVELSSENGGSGDDYGTGNYDCSGTFTVFDDESQTSITGAAAPFAGSLRPEQALAAFDGKEAQGNWTLRVEDGAGPGDAGVLYCFELVLTRETTPAAQADLAVTKADSPDPVRVGNRLTYTLTVTNGGPADATGVTLTDPLAADATFISATPSQGACAGTRTVACSLGDIASGAAATVTIVVEPTRAGTLANTAEVRAAQADPDPADNAAAATTAIHGGGRTIRGTKGPDVLRGTAGDDTILGLGGDDRILGLGGNDRLLGGPGNDVLVGGAGLDRLVGGPGDDRFRADDFWRDVLRGGPGADSCRVDRGIDVFGLVEQISYAGPPHIAFESNRDGNWEIYAMRADGTGQTNVTGNPSEDRDPSWSPDLKKLAFASDRLGAFDLFTMNADGTWVPGLLTSDLAADEIRPDWSPDGAKITWQEFSYGDVWVMNADGTGKTNLTNYLSTGNSGDSPDWSPGGAKIAFGFPGTSYDIDVMNADGTGIVDLTSASALNEIHPAWSPDGTKIAFQRDLGGAGGEEIFVMNADGTGVTKLTSSPADEAWPAWSPDGTKIAFATDRDGNWEIYVMQANGSGVTRLTHDPADDLDPDWR